jgi:hypothetical protein
MSEVAQLEYQLEHVKILKDRKQAAERLAGNADFRAIVLHGFCRDDAARYVQESGDPLLTAEQRVDALNLAQASGHLKRYLLLQIQMGVTADRNIKDIEAALVEARYEEGNH